MLKTDQLFIAIKINFNKLYAQSSLLFDQVKPMSNNNEKVKNKSSNCNQCNLILIDCNM